MRGKGEADSLRGGFCHKNEVQVRSSPLRPSCDGLFVFDDIPKVTVKPSNKKDILRPDTIIKVFEAPWENDMNRLANLLAMYTGMRASEVQALRVCDIFDKYIWVSHA